MKTRNKLYIAGAIGLAVYGAGYYQGYKEGKFNGVISGYHQATKENEPQLHYIEKWANKPATFEAKVEKK